MQKILSIIESMAHEKNLSVESAMEAFKEALLQTARRLEGDENEYEVEIDYDTQSYHLYKVLTVVADDDPRAEEEPEKYITVEQAKEYDDEIEPGDKIRSEIHLEDYGRTAAANLFHELEYHIQRRIEQDLFEKYKAKVGSIIIGTVSRVDDGGNTYVEIGELKGILSMRNRIKG
jgi:N utilization substance protein A